MSTVGFAANSPYKYLLNDPNFNRFVQNIRRRSEDSAYETLRRFGMIDKRFHKPPKYFSRMNTKRAKKFLLNMIENFETKGGEDGGDLAGSYIQNYVKSINRWLEYNDISPPKKINVEGAEESVRYENERPPTPEQLKVILEHADLRARAALSIMAFAGTRIEVLGKRVYPGGLDGLKIQDLPEMTIIGDKVDFQAVPTLIIVRKPVSKIHRKYGTYLCDEGCTNLRNYLEYRIRELGEKLTPDSPIITSDVFHPGYRGKHIRTTNISDLMRKPIRSAGFQWRPMVMRRYFDVRLISAESDHFIQRDWRVWWMGHTGDIEFTYTYAKGLSDELIEEMREGYRKAADKYLKTTTKKDPSDEDRVLATINRRMLSWAGYTDEEVAKLGNAAEFTEQQMNDLLAKKTTQALGGVQKVVPLDEVRNWISQGWLFVQALPNNEAVMRLPSPLLSGLFALGVDHLEPNLALRQTL